MDLGWGHYRLVHDRRLPWLPEGLRWESRNTPSGRAPSARHCALGTDSGQSDVLESSYSVVRLTCVLCWTKSDVLWFSSCLSLSF